MTPETTDILISGGGIAGLIAAAAFGDAGFSVICVDPLPRATDATPGATDSAPPATGAKPGGATDLRTTAFLQPAQGLLSACGLWGRLAPHATPLRVMRIVDATDAGAGAGTGTGPKPRLIRDFNSADISDAPFGWNLPNRLLRRELVAHLATLPGVDFRPGVGIAGVMTREGQARATLSDGGRVAARLLIGADGRDSPVRHAAGISVKTTRYGQKALAFAVTHPVPHENVSTEIHHRGGPFTLVPLPDHEGQPCSAVVWMQTGAEALRLSALPVPDFGAAMTARSCGLLGPLSLITRRTVWPVISRVAGRMAAERIALMAEAAHVVPPIGAQGLNMSLADLRVLSELAARAPADIGSAAMLAAYHRRRHPQVRLRVAGIDALNRVSMAGARAPRDVRAAALAALCSVPPARRALMRAGLAAR